MRDCTDQISATEMNHTPDRAQQTQNLEDLNIQAAAINNGGLATQAGILEQRGTDGARKALPQAASA